VKRIFVIVAAGLALGLSAAVWANANDRAQCETACPSGTRLSTIEQTEYAQANAENGTFLYVTESCEAFCEPVVPCITPNVPVVDGSGFRCEPLPGVADFEPDSEVDLSFGDLWDASQAEVTE